jgi:hypothetical protein
MAQSNNPQRRASLQYDQERVRKQTIGYGQASKLKQTELEGSRASRRSRFGQRGYGAMGRGGVGGSRQHFHDAIDLPRRRTDREMATSRTHASDRDRIVGCERAWP